MANNKKDQLDMSDLSGSLPAVAAAAAALSAEDRAGLVNALKNKLQNLAGQHSDVLENLSPTVRKRVEVLRGIQSEHDELETKFFEERAALELKYQKLYAPLYARRYDIVNGVVEVDGLKDDAATDQTDGNSKDDKVVPDFWLTAMKNNEILAEEISERDEDALKYLKDIKWCRIDEPKGFKLEFFFDTNPYFKILVLTKVYHVVEVDEPLLEKAIGTNIEWLPGKCLTQKILKKMPKKGSKNAKHITKTEMEQDYDIGSTIRDKIIPHAVSWFTGEATQEDEFDGIEEDNDDDDDDDEDEIDDDDEEDEDEDEDEEESKSKRKAKKGSTPNVGATGEQGERPPECKQQ